MNGMRVQTLCFADDTAVTAETDKKLDEHIMNRKNMRMNKVKQKCQCIAVNC